MIKAIAATTDADQKNDLLDNLGLFYIHQMHDERKAMSLVPAVTNPYTAYTLRLHAIAYDGDLTSQQKITEYQKLLSQYPNQKTFTYSLIAIAKDHPTGQ